MLEKPPFQAGIADVDDEPGKVLEGRVAELALLPDSGSSRYTPNLKVYFPHLQDTIEVVQVQRVLTRMNTFLRLMHEGLILPDEKDRRIDLLRLT